MARLSCVGAGNLFGCLAVLVAGGIVAQLVPPVAPRPRTDTNSSSLMHLKQLGTALDMYSQDYDSRMPPMDDAATIRAALLPYCKDRSMYFQPETKEPYRPNPTLSYKDRAHIVRPERTAAIYEGRPSAHGYRGVTFADGHAKIIREEEWAALSQTSGPP